MRNFTIAVSIEYCAACRNVMTLRGNLNSCHVANTIYIYGNIIW